jgi:hypothetical protein
VGGGGGGRRRRLGAEWRELFVSWCLLRCVARVLFVGGDGLFGTMQADKAARAAADELTWKVCVFARAAFVVTGWCGVFVGK